MLHQSALHLSNIIEASAFLLCSSAGEETPVSVLQQCEGKGMGDGISNSIHQSDWWSTRQRGLTRRVKEWRCEYSKKIHSHTK